MATTMIPTKKGDSPMFSAASLIDPTRISDITPTAIPALASITTLRRTDQGLTARCSSPAKATALAVGDGRPPPAISSKIAGMTSTTEASSSISDWASAAVRSKCWRSRRARLGVHRRLLDRLAGFAEDRHAGGEGVEEVAAADRAELALGEEPGHGRLAGGRGDADGVVVGLAEEVAAAPVAGEQQHPPRLPAGHRRQQQLEVLVRGGRVADVELQRLADLDAVGDRDRAGLRVGPDQAPDQEVTAVEAGLVLVDDLADLEAAAAEQLVLAGVEGGEHLAQPVDRGAAAQLVDDVALAAGDGERRADGPAALADDRADLHGPDQGDADGAAVVHLGAAEQPVPARLPGAGDHPADHRQASLLLVEPLQEAVGREGERVRQQQHAGPLLAREGGPAGDPVAVVQRQHLQGEGPDVDAGQGGRPDRQPGCLLQLAAAADHALGGAADDRRGAGPLRQAEGDAAGGVGMVHREEADDQVWRAAELLEGQWDGLVERPLVVRGGRDGGAEGEHEPKATGWHPSA